MTDVIDNTGVAFAAPAPTPAPVDPLASFAASPAEQEGLLVEIEDPLTGVLLMKWRLARFGGSNNAKIVRAEREIKAKLTQGQRRAIDAGAGDPDIVQRMNRQVFVRASVLGFEMVNPTLAARYPTYSPEVADTILAAYPGVYDALSEKATDEEAYAKAALEDDVKN